MQVTADDMSDLESVEEDGQMMLHKKRPLWRTLITSAALAVLDEFRNIKNAGLPQLYVGSVKNGSDTVREEIVDHRDLEEWYMLGNCTNRDTQTAQ